MINLERPGRKHSEESKRKIRENHADSRGSGNGNSKLTEELVLDIRKYHATGKIHPNELARIYKVSPSSIYDIIARRRWKHI